MEGRNTAGKGTVAKTPAPGKAVPAKAAAAQAPPSAVGLTMGGNKGDAMKKTEKWKGTDKGGEFKKSKDPEQVKRMAVYAIAVGLCGAFFGLAASGTDIPLSGKMHLGTWQWVMLAIICLMGPIGIYENGRRKRITEIEERLSDFLRDIAESGRAGQTLHQAITTAAKGNYGGLTTDIKKMAIQISWGVPSNEVLSRFAKRVNTPLVNRSVILINEASSAGGNVSKVLEAAANDVKEMQLMQQERQIQMGMYVIVIFVSFVVFLVVILIIFNTFVPQMENMKEDMLEAQASGEGGGALAGGFDPTKVDFDEIRLIFLISGLVQGIGDGLVAGLMGSGRITDGLKHGFIMVIIVFVIFTFAMPV